MNVKVVSVQKVTTKEGTVMYRVFASLPDGSVGNFWGVNEYKVGDTVTLVVAVNKECKFIVRPAFSK
ncbi:hypothetical protein [Emergencia sp.]|uniref:hypothetical protein n=1 Tax=Emergencia sp. TaxID=1926557 RepID=UPI003AF0B764